VVAEVDRRSSSFGRRSGDLRFHDLLRPCFFADKAAQSMRTTSGVASPAKTIAGTSLRRIRGRNRNIFVYNSQMPFLSTTPP